MIDAAAQLESIAAVASAVVRVSIVTIDRGMEITRWLCDACTESACAKRPDGSVGWTLKGRKDPPHPLPCEACGTMGGTLQNEQAA